MNQGVEKIRISNILTRSRIFTYEEYLAVQARLRERRRELILFCEHPPTITAGVKTDQANLLISPGELRRRGVNLVKIGRGGDFTAHEPGQVVIYPHIDLKRRGLGIGVFFDGLLEVTRVALERTWEIKTLNRKEAPGLYLPGGEKLVSIGIMFKSFFSSFGLALNLQNDLSTFQYINPCGEDAGRITSIQKAGGAPAHKENFLKNWAELFEGLLLEVKTKN